MAQHSYACSTAGANFRRWHGLLALVCLAAACAGGQAEVPPPATVTEAPPPPPPPVHQRGKDKLIAEVGPSGGVLELADGARVEIPAGALPKATVITFAKGHRTTAFDNREHERTLGRPLDLTPGLAAQSPIVVSIPVAQLPEGFEAEDLTLATEVRAEHQRDYQSHAVQTRWDYQQAKQAAGRVTAELHEIPGMRLQFLVSRDE